MLRIALRRPYQLIRCSTELTRPVVNDEVDLTPEIEQAKSIRELREIKSRLESPNSDPSQEEESDMEILGYIHMKDERLAFVDPERENYVVSRLKPGMGDMDPETRQVHAKMTFIRRVTLITVISILVMTQFYALLASGFDCEMEEKFMVEDPTYAATMLNGIHGNKWKAAMEGYFAEQNKDIPWAKKTVRF